MADRYDYERGYNSEHDRSRDDYGRERPSGRPDERYRGGDDDRGLVQRAGDEVRSWFGDEEAARRRQRDELRDDRDEYSDGRQRYAREGSGRGDYERQHERGFGSGRESPQGYSQRSSSGSRDRAYGTRGYGSFGEFGRSAGGYGGATGRQGYDSGRSRDQQTMGNPDWDRSSSIYGDQQGSQGGSHGWGPAARGYRESSWGGDRNQADYGSSRGRYDSSSQYGSSWRDDAGERDRYGSSHAWRAETGPHSGRGPRGYQRSDDRIREDICDRLTRHGHIDATDVRITVQNGDVTLEGMVDSRDEKRLAEDVAEAVDGVRDVTNHLKAHRGGNREGDAYEGGIGHPGTPTTLGVTGAGGGTSSSGAGSTGSPSTDKKR